MVYILFIYNIRNHICLYICKYIKIHKHISTYIFKYVKYLYITIYMHTCWQEWLCQLAVQRKIHRTHVHCHSSLRKLSGLFPYIKRHNLNSVDAKKGLADPQPPDPCLWQQLPTAPGMLAQHQEREKKTLSIKRGKSPGSDLPVLKAMNHKTWQEDSG